MRIIVITFILIILLLYFDLTSQWVRFSYRSRSRLRHLERNNTIRACQRTTGDQVAKLINFNYPEHGDKIVNIFKAFGGVGMYVEKRFYYIEIYSRLLLLRKHKGFWRNEITTQFYVGDCACADYKCTYFQAICIYTYWFGWYVWGNHSMCNVDQITYWKSQRYQYR